MSRGRIDDVTGAERYFLDVARRARRLWLPRPVQTLLALVGAVVKPVGLLGGAFLGVLAFPPLGSVAFALGAFFGAAILPRLVGAALVAVLARLEARRERVNLDDDAAPARSGEGARPHLPARLFLHRRHGPTGALLAALDELAPHLAPADVVIITRRVTWAARLAVAIPAATAAAAVLAWLLPAPAVVVERVAPDALPGALAIGTGVFLVAGIMLQQSVPRALLVPLVVALERGRGHFEASLAPTVGASGEPVALSTDVTPSASRGR